MAPGRFKAHNALSVFAVVGALAAPAAIAPPQPALAQTIDLRGSDTLAYPGTSAPAGGAIDAVVPTGPADSLRSGAATGEPDYFGAANYGAPRPRVRLPRRYPPRRRPHPALFSPLHHLPPLEPYRTSSQARHATHLRPSLDAPPSPPPPATVAAAPTIRTKPRPRAEAHPFDPVGIGVGSLRLLPFVEADYGFDSNPNRLSTGATGSRLLRTNAGLGVRSEWERHDFHGDLRLGYAKYFSNPDADRPDGTGSFIGRVDVTRDTAVNVRGRFNIDTQRPGAVGIASNQPNVTIINRPAVVALGTSLGVSQKFNRLQLSLDGAFDRTSFENARYSDGSTLNLASTSYNAYGVSTRASYAWTPDLTPFVEGTLDKRVHDTTLDVFGAMRDSSGLAVRGGAAVNVSELVRGEASGGYAERSYDDPRLSKLRGPTIDAALVYTPTPLTTLTLRGATTLNETTGTGAAGILSHAMTAQLAHEPFRNVTLTATASYLTNDYQGANIHETGYTTGLRLNYNLTRAIAVTASYAHEKLHSTTPGADYTANVFLVGLRLQR
ncbi:MAG: outer membrane beta-barrel protein [Methylocystis sp.]|nr:outer membrane beta-barrel protein [Methylocystis sp.]